MTTLCVSTANARPDLLYQQITGYNKAFNNDVFHIIHLSDDFFKSLMNERIDDFNKLKSFNNVYFFNNVKTQHGRIFHAMLQCVLKGITLGIPFDYIYFHTSSDLIFRTGLSEHVKAYDIGASPAFPISDTDYWKKRIINDKNSIFFRENIEFKEVFKRRVEGSFFKREIFFELIYPLLTSFGTHQLELTQNYPIEEVEFVWCIELYCKKNLVRRTSNTIAALGGQKNFVSTEDIEQLHSNKPNIFGVKRFDPDIHHESRKYAFHLLGLPFQDY